MPRCYLDENGEHFWFDHECSDVGAEWAAKGHPLDAAAIEHFQGARNHTRLPTGPNNWKIVTNSPLTISPSILCGQCGVHGFWQADQWVPA